LSESRCSGKGFLERREWDIPLRSLHGAVLLEWEELWSILQDFHLDDYGQDLGSGEVNSVYH